MAGSAAQRKELDATTHLTNPALFDFWESAFFGSNDIAVLHGGRSSSKTRDTACQLVRLVNHVGVKMRVLCIRRFQNKIQESVYTELKWAINHLGLKDEYDVQKTTSSIRRPARSSFSTASSAILRKSKALLTLTYSGWRKPKS